MTIQAAYEIISSDTVGGDDFYTFTDFDSDKYTGYIFRLLNLTPGTGATHLNMLGSTDGGVTYIATADNYSYSSATRDTLSTDALTYTHGTDSSIPITGELIGSGFGDAGWNGDIYLSNPHAEFETQVISNGMGFGQDDVWFSTETRAMMLQEETETNGIKLLFNVGFIESGEILAIGVVK